MPKWSYEEMRQALEAFSSGGDPEDPKERKRLRILKAATDLFARHGYRKTNVDDVARRAGVAKGTVYLYFKTKSELLLQAIIEEKKLAFESMKPIFDETLQPSERLRRYIRSSIVIAEQLPMMSKLLAGDHEILMVFDAMDADMTDRTDEMRVEFLAGLLDEVARPHRWTRDELEDRAKAVFALLFSLMMSDERTRLGLPTERLAAVVADMIVDGLAHPNDATNPTSTDGGTR